VKIDRYERIWMWGSAVILAAFFVTMAGAARSSIGPPSHVQTIDPQKVLSDPLFRQQGTWLDERGRVHATIVATAFAWLPSEITVPAETPVTFHVTSIDVLHGFEIVRTNAQATVIPGYVSQFTTQFAPGQYMIVCNEYCGIGHHIMAAKLAAVPRSQWRATSPPPDVPPSPEAPHAGH
jgi:cytochrome c oxidase subunit II